MSALLVLIGSVASCEDDPGPQVPKDAIRIGAALPFSGSLASTGIHLERALMLAVEDVNRLGGVDGHPLALTVRDSNSGSDRGLQEIRDLIIEEEVSYLVGPEEDNLSLGIVRDIKSQDIMHILPSVASPAISDAGSRGAWLRLVPGAATMGCAMASKAVADGVESMRRINSRDDYHSELSAFFGSTFATLGGKPRPAVNVEVGEFSYARAISQLNRFTGDATLMLTYPATAATIIKEMGRSGQLETWYLSPKLRDDALLWNLPEGTLRDATGFSPTLSNDEECDYEPPAEGAGGAGGGPAFTPLGGLGGELGPVEAPEITADIKCEPSRAARFSAYYEERWGTAPLEAAHFYYDAIIVLALGLKRAHADGLDDPAPQELLEFLSEDVAEAKPVEWDALSEAFERTEEGELVRYYGAAGEYDFNARGQNVRTIIDTWVIDGDNEFVQRDSVTCNKEFTIDR